MLYVGGSHRNLVLFFRVNLDLLKILIKLKQNIGKISAVLPYIASQPAWAAGIEIWHSLQVVGILASQPAWAAENTRTILSIYAAF